MASTLPSRSLGPLEVSAQGLGCMSMTDVAYGPADEDEAVATLAWLSAQGDDVVPIPGTKRRRHLEENVGALSVELTAGDLSRLDGLVPAGDRAVDMTFADRDTPPRP